MKPNRLFLQNKYLCTSEPNVYARVTMVADKSYAYLNYGSICTPELFVKYLQEEVHPEDYAKCKDYEMYDFSEYTYPMRFYIYFNKKFAADEKVCLGLSEKILGRWCLSVYTFYEFDLDSLLRYVKGRFDYVENIRFSDQTHKYYVKVNAYADASYMEFGEEVDITDAVFDTYKDVTLGINKIAEEILAQ